jgi:hypothetical protein
MAEEENRLVCVVQETAKDRTQRAEEGLTIWGITHR